MNTLELIEPEKPAICGNDVVLLPYGLIGFERVKNYSLLADPRAEPFLWFRMLEDDKHAFLVMPPATVIPDYQPDLEDLDVEFLELEASSDVLILNTVTLWGLG
jgi:flagellar assembly factor FliW